MSKTTKWLNAYMQIMLSALLDILKKDINFKEKKGGSVRYKFKYALFKIKQMHRRSRIINLIIRNILDCLEECESNYQHECLNYRYDVLRAPITPMCFIRLTENGERLVRVLKDFFPHTVALEKAENILTSLKAHMIKENTISLEHSQDLIDEMQCNRHQVEHSMFPRNVVLEEETAKRKKRKASKVHILTENTNEPKRNRLQIEHYENCKIIRTKGQKLSELRISKNKDMFVSSNIEETQQNMGITVLNVKEPGSNTLTSKSRRSPERLDLDALDYEP